MVFGALLPWRLAVGVLALIPALSILLLAFVHESPSWLLRNNLRKKAFASLMFYRGNSSVATLEMERCQSNIDKDEKKKEALGSSLQQRVKYQLVNMSRPEFLKPFFLINFMLNIGLECAGFPIIAFYMHTVLKKMNIPMDEYLLSICILAYRAVLMMILPFIMKSSRRRPVYLTSGCLVAAGHTLLATYMFLSPSISSEMMPWTNWTPLIAVLLIYAGFGLGYGPLVFVLQGELLPAQLRSAGCGLIGVVNNFFIFTIVKTGPTLMNSLGMSGIFYSYAIITIVTLITAFFFMPETKGMSLEDIEEVYASRIKTSKNQTDHPKVHIHEQPRFRKASHSFLET